VNLHRSPLAGRNFECFSEDPWLAGKLAAGYVRGVQSAGVFATVKHFVGNDAEFERGTINSVIDERSLRELYLLPFELAVKEGGALAIMSAYNRVNGAWVTEQPRLLVDILRDEWGFAGLVMTDWNAVVDTATSLQAGLDLEMPGPGRSFGPALADAIEKGLVKETDLDAAMRRLLGGFDRIGALDAPEPPVDPRPTTDGDRALIRAAAADASVLLWNNGILPLAPSVRRVAVVGSHAVSPTVNGGGSAGVVLHPMVSPLDALSAALGDDVEVVYRRGAEVTEASEPLGGPLLAAPTGFDIELFTSPGLTGDLAEQRHLDELRLAVLIMAFEENAPVTKAHSARAQGTVVPTQSGTFQLGLSQTGGYARVYLDGTLLLDGMNDPPPSGGRDFFGFASQDLLADVHLERDVPVQVVVEFERTDATVLLGFREGARIADAESLLDDAADAASDADVVVLHIGTTEEWETEGRDQPTFGLPGRQEELAARVIAANPRTVVVLNAASAVDLSSVDEAAALVQCWFGGQEMGNAIADVLTGRSEPGGRLPVTIGKRLGHYPSHGNFPGENGEIRYGEGLAMGYRGFDLHETEPRFPFGHGLGYTSFEFGEPQLSSGVFEPGTPLTISVPVTNTGDRAGAEVVQCYVAPGPSRLTRPPRELKAFAKVRLEPGATEVVVLVLDERAFAYWDPGQPDFEQVRSRPVSLFGTDAHLPRRAAGWQVDPGTYRVLVGRSASRITHECTVDVISR
jgi:beta-glucosidase